ncbi:hypothetical protein Tco_1146787 [Tanacetum coccineum]
MSQYDSWGGARETCQIYGERRWLADTFNICLSLFCYYFVIEWRGEVSEKYTHESDTVARQEPSLSVSIVFGQYVYALHLSCLREVLIDYLEETVSGEDLILICGSFRVVLNVQNSRVVVQNVQGRLNRGQGNNARGAVAAGNEGSQNRVGNANPGQAKHIKCYNYNGIRHIARQCTHPKRPQNSEYFKDKMLLMQAQENGVVLDEEELLFIVGGQDSNFNNDVDEPPVQDLALNVENVFQADQCDAFDSDVDEAPTAQTMFMANLSLADPIYDEAGPSYDSDILSEVQDHDNYIDSVGKYHEVHEMQNDVQQNYVVDSDAKYTSDSNIIMYEQYVKDNAVQVAAQCVFVNEQNKVVNESLNAELARYKEQVAIYEKRARFELTEREHKINEQMRIIITDRNIKEETLKRELHSVKMQLNSTINHNKLMKEEVATLKKDFKQKENKYLEDFLDMKALKEKSALYNGHEIVKTNHSPVVVHDSEDTLEIAEKLR